MAKVLICALPFVFVEFYFDSSKKSRIRELYLFPIFLWIAYFVMSCVVLFIGMKIQRALDITPLFDRLNLSYWSQVAIWIIITDFVIYWYHRLEHTIPFLWTFHSTHHAIEDLNSINQYGHWFEGMVRFFMVTLPVAIFVATPVLDATVIAAIYAVWAVYNHCDRIEARLPKFLTCLFADNVYHRYHHGIEKKYHNSNYANMFSIWDRMFGTQTIPVGNDFPDTGLGYLPPPKNLKEYLAHPFSTKKL